MFAPPRGDNALIILAGLLVLAAGSAASAQPPGIKAFQPSTKLVREGAWRDFKYRLLVPGDSVSRGATMDVAAKFATYAVPGARYGFHIVVLHDPRTNRTCVMPGVGRVTGFYVSDDAGMFAAHLGSTGDLQLARSFLEIPGQVLDLDAAEKRFETDFDEVKVNQHLGHNVSLDLTTAAGPDVFSMPGTAFVSLDTGGDITGRLFHLVVTNAKTTKSATVWIDLTASRIARAIDSEGRERRNVSSTKRWIERPVQLMRSGANGVGVASQATEVSARAAEFFVLGTGEYFYVTAIQDPRTKKVTFVNTGRLYVSMSSGLTSGFTFAQGMLFHRQFSETAGTEDIVAVLEEFEKTLDPTKLRRVMHDEIRISLGDLFGRNFFVSGSHSVDARLELAEVTDGILHLVMVSPVTGQTAACWVDIRPGGLFLERVVRAELEGQARPIPSPWIDGKARLVTPGRPARLEKLREVDARYGSLLFVRSGSKLAVVHDAQNKSISIVNGFNDYYRFQDTVRRNSDVTFYVPRGDGLMAVIVSYSGIVAFSPAYFVATDSVGGPDAAIALFERSFDRDAFERQIAARRVAVNIAEAIREDVFFDRVDKRRVSPRVDIIDLQGNTLRLVLTNPASKGTVTLWFDVNSLRLIRSSVGGDPRVGGATAAARLARK